ncbi:NAD(P)-binding protein [Periconia macrospinosa]|uniref:NAD(P)-binding protein n=1 Tax=Periconia macrospinosa TaxID=97972 RepID=A0A2V1DSF0_9PLEO|nr:NAD(P)-binding protein [Periconia macrospinosa]
MANTARRIVVSGATGKQGGALISSLLSASSHPFEIYALTRNATSRSAVALSTKPNVFVIQGNFDNPVAVFSQVEKPWGFFSVTNPMDAKKEEAQGKAMTKAAIDAGIKHIVFTATDRGKNSDEDPTTVPHFASKFKVEKDIVEKSKQSGGTWTFLRPVAFYENLSNDFLGKGFISMWRLNGNDSKMKFVSTKDIGKVAAEAFLKADSEQYKNKAIALAGDEISLEEFGNVFKEETGQVLPETFSFVGKGLKFALHEQLGIMFNWFKTNGFGVDPAESKKAYAFLKDFRTWLRTESAWKRE